MRHHGINFWKQVPFLRLLIPLVAGILIGYYTTIKMSYVFITGITAFASFILFRFLPNTIKYRRGWINGCNLNMVWISAGILLCHFADIRTHKTWFGNADLSKSNIAITIAEPLAEKERSFKTTGIVYAIRDHGKWKTCDGRILLYFSKDNLPSLKYGDHVFFQAVIQPIKNAGNPGAFDYKQYCAFQGIHHQVYLKKKNYCVIKNEKSSFNKTLFRMRDWILGVLKKHIPGDKESGVAEALLVGYRNDLDRDLVQAYSKTGVVHIIAISGLHLGMIYGLLVGIFNCLPRTRLTRILQPLTILTVLWGFSLLTGAAASILRSAVMFSFIVAGQSLERKSNIYNTLAASASCLLLYNPYFLWDVGFLLSYSAVLSIIIFMRPVYKLVYIKNKLLNNIWQLNAVTISAQILTLPLILSCFHQFPNLFLFTNGVAVPLSGLILYAELLLPFFVWLPSFACFFGNIISLMVKQMDNYIERTASLPFAVTNNINISLLQTIVLYVLISAIARWLLAGKNKALLTGMVLLILFIAPSTLAIIRTKQQQKLIVYQVPGQTAIDVIEGNTCRFIGNDTVVNGPSNAFVLRPARVRYSVVPGRKFGHTLISGKLIAGSTKRVLILNRLDTDIKSDKIKVDIIILCAGVNTSPAQLSRFITCSQYVFDGSVPLWKIQKWKKEADSLHLRHHSTPEQGAFEADL